METLNNKVTGGSLTAAEWNQVPSELQNVITQTSQSLTNADLNQVGKGIAEYVSNGDFYTDSGATNAYVLTQIGTKQAPTSYVDGLVIRFLPGNTNTSASTVNVASLGVKSIVNFDGSALIGGELPTGQPTRAFFDLSNNRFQLVLELGETNFSVLKSGRKNYLINGNFDIWQRGTSFSTNLYSSDRWKTGSTTSVTQSSTVPADSGASFSASLTATGSNAIVAQGIELPAPGIFGGNQVALQFEADVPIGEDAFVFIAFRDTLGSGTNQIIVFTGNIGAGTGVFIKYTKLLTLPSANPTNTLLEVQVGCAGVTPSCSLSRVQLEASLVATDFEYRSLGEELAFAQRYYLRYESTGDVIHVASGYATTSSNSDLRITLPVTMRTNPTISIGGDASPMRIRHEATSADSNNVIISDGGDQSFRVVATVTSGTPLTIGNGTLLLVKNLSGAFIDFDAEL